MWYHHLLLMHLFNWGMLQTWFHPFQPFSFVAAISAGFEHIVGDTLTTSASWDVDKPEPFENPLRLIYWDHRHTDCCGIWHYPEGSTCKNMLGLTGVRRPHAAGSDSVWLQAHFYITGTFDLYGKLANWGTNAILCSSLFIVQKFQNIYNKTGNWTSTFFDSNSECPLTWLKLKENYM